MITESKTGSHNLLVESIDGSTVIDFSDEGFQDAIVVEMQVTDGSIDNPVSDTQPKLTVGMFLRMEQAVQLCEAVRAALVRNITHGQSPETD